MSNIAYAGPLIKTSSGGRIGQTICPVRVDTAWALLRFFREGKDWKTEEMKRQWAEEELAAFLEREKTLKVFKPKLVT